MKKSKLRSLAFIILTILLIPIALLIQPHQIIQKQYLHVQAANETSVSYQGHVQK